MWFRTCSPAEGYDSSSTPGTFSTLGTLKGKRVKVPAKRKPLCRNQPAWRNNPAGEKAGVMPLNLGASSPCFAYSYDPFGLGELKSTRRLLRRRLLR